MKDKTWPFYHNLLILHMVDGLAYCAQRRAAADAPARAVIRDGTPSVDTMNELDNNMSVNSECLYDAEFANGLHLSVVLLICFGIQKDDQGHVYTLQKFNCYFFARTMLLAMIRHAVMESVRLHSPDTKSVRAALSGDEEKETDQSPQDAELMTLQKSLRTKLWKDIFDGEVRLDVHAALSRTLWRAHAQWTVSSAITDVVRDATRRANLNDWRRRWVDKHREPFGETKLVAVWDAAWRDVWTGMWNQIYTNAGIVGQNWFHKWDHICRPNLGANDQDASVLVRKYKPVSRVFSCCSRHT